MAEEIVANEAGETSEPEFNADDYVPKAEHEKTQAELDRFRAKHAEAEKHRKEQESLARRSAEEAAKNAGDVQALEKSWQEKLDSSVGELSGQLKSYESMVHDLTVGSAAVSLAAKIAIDGCAEGLEPHIKSRLKTEIVEGHAVVKVMGKDGRPSAMTLDDLEKELKATAYLAPMIRGSSARGAGAPGVNGNPNASKQMLREDWLKLDPKAQAEFLKKGGRPVDSWN